jgi:signal transduction histidine kinase
MNGQQAIMASVERNVRKLQIQVTQGHDYTLRIDFTDNGIGILQEHLEHIFKMFFRTLTATEKLSWEQLYNQGSFS